MTNEPSYRFFCQKCQATQKVLIDDMIVERGIAFGRCPKCKTWFSHRQPGDYSVISKIMDSESPEGREFRARHSDKYKKVEIIDNKRAAPKNGKEQQLFTFICPTCSTSQMVSENEADVKMKFKDTWHYFFNCMRCKEQVEINPDDYLKKKAKEIEERAEKRRKEEESDVIDLQACLDDPEKRLLRLYELNITDMSNVSDGYHTFDALYNQRLYLSAALAKHLPMYAWKSQRHNDGQIPFDGTWFIMGFSTPEGQYTYHYKLEHWDLFECEVLERAPKWDGHTDKDVSRLMSIPRDLPPLPPNPHEIKEMP